MGVIYKYLCNFYPPVCLSKWRLPVHPVLQLAIYCERLRMYINILYTMTVRGMTYGHTLIIWLNPRVGCLDGQICNELRLGFCFVLPLIIEAKRSRVAKWSWGWEGRQKALWSVISPHASFSHNPTQGPTVLELIRNAWGSTEWW